MHIKELMMQDLMVRVIDMEYTIILAITDRDLVAHVSDSIKRGWVPLGGAFVDPKGFCQTMTKTGRGPPKKRFKPPTLDEVKEYILENKFGVDANTWINFYQSKNWMVGKSKMKDWKASVRTWQYKTQNNKDPLNIPQPKKFNAEKIDESKQVSPAAVRKMLRDNDKINAYKATGQLPPDQNK